LVTIASYDLPRTPVLNVFVGRDMRAALVLAVVAAIVMISPSGAVEAPSVWLDPPDLQKTFGGKVLEGRYGSGKAFTEHYKADGSIAYTEGGITIGGHWSVTEGTFCTIYDTNPTGGCYRVARVGPNCFEFYFVTRTEEAAPGPEDGKPSWTARGSISGEASACHDGANV
jgi:hypothetical protein